MRVGLTRPFHSGRASLAFRRATANKDGASATPRKSTGEFRWFEEAAPYSKFSAQAPEVTKEQADISVATLPILSSATPGQLLSWPGEVQAQLHHLGSYKPSQQNEIFRSKVSVVREATLDVWSNHLAPGKSLMITGDAGVGKTSLLTQAHAAAKLQGWGVIHISQADKLLNGSTDAVYDPSTKLWNQPMFMSRLWKKAVKANRALLGDKAKSPRGKTLKELAALFADNKLLITVDNINALSHSVYAKNTNQQNENLYHDDLEVVNTLLRWLGAPPKNAAVFGSVSGFFKNINWDGYAYAKLKDYDSALVGKLAAAPRLDLKHFSGVEAEAFVKYLHAAEVSSKPWEELYQVGNGNPRTILATATNFAY